MERKRAIWWGMVIGSTVGGFIPSLWDASILSMSGVILTAVGGFAGIWLGYNYGQ